jgi:putative ABC transport system substrate-binding protein
MLKPGKIFYIKALVGFFLTWGMAFSFAYPEPIRIAVLKSRNLEPYNAALASFEQALKDRGYDAQFLYYDLEGNTENGRAISEEIIRTNPKLILTSGTEATKVAKENIKDIPVVFSVVLDPVGNGFVETLDRSGTNLVGAALDVPVSAQFEALISVVPKIKRIGVVYDPQKTGKIIEEAESEAGKIGLLLIKIPVSSQNDVPQAIEGLKDRVDALWAPVDNTVYTPNSTQFILLFTLRNKIPFMAFSDQLVKAGAMMGLRSDYHAQGEAAARLAIEILRGKKPSGMATLLSEKPFLFLNQRAADVIGVKFSPKIVERAKEIFR